MRSCRSIGRSSSSARPSGPIPATHTLMPCGPRWLLVEREDAEHALTDCAEAIQLDPNAPLGPESAA